MKFEAYLTMLRWEAGIGIRVVRVQDITDHDNHTHYDVILIPTDMDGEDGVSYRIVSDIDEIRDRLKLWPTQFAVTAAWPLTDLVRGAMYMEDAVADYFESEV